MSRLRDSGQEASQAQQGVLCLTASASEPGLAVEEEGGDSIFFCFKMGVWDANRDGDLFILL